jgi:hypothetical protein
MSYFDYWLMGHGVIFIPLSHFVLKISSIKHNKMERSLFLGQQLVMGWTLELYPPRPLIYTCVISATHPRNGIGQGTLEFLRCLLIQRHGSRTGVAVLNL